MSIDLTPVADEKPEGERKLVPEDTFRVRVTNATPGKSKVKGTPFLELEFQIQAGEFKGWNVWRQYYITERAIIFLQRAVEALGASWPEDGQLDESTLIDREAVIRVSHRPWEVKDSSGLVTKSGVAPEVAWIEAIDDSNATPVPPSAPAGQMVEHVPANAVTADDDIPF